METNASDSFFLAGTHRHSLDDKHRVTIPARWRADGIEYYALRADGEAALHLIPASELRRLKDKIVASPDYTSARRKVVMRHLFAHVHACPFDKQGRVVLPVEFCKDLSLTGEVILSGVGARIEVRSPSEWDSVIESEKPDAFLEVADALGI